MNLFDCEFPLLKITKPIKLIELFAGYGSQALALKYLGVDFNHHVVCEFNKYAIAAYNQIHETNFETSDVTKLKGDDLKIDDVDKFTYLLTYSFPCQDLSMAGNRKGMRKGSGTRSGSLWEVERLLNEVENLPQILLMENVPQVKSADGFVDWLMFLESLGYKNYYQDLNSKFYGIPQSRNRTFMVSILEDFRYEFPNELPLKYKLKAFLEKEVDEKYFLSQKLIDCFSDMTDRNGFVRGKIFKPHDENSEIAKTIKTRAGDRPEDNFIIMPENTKKSELEKKLIENNLVKENDVITHSYTTNRMNKWEERGLSIKENNICPTLTQRVDCLGVVVKDNYIGTFDYHKSDNFMKGKSRFNKNTEIIPTILAKSSSMGIVESPKVIGGIGVKKSNNNTQFHQQDRIYDDKVALCVTTTAQPYYIDNSSLRIRKLTPKESFRLMGVLDSDSDKIKCSNAQKYNRAGNSIVTTVLMGIFGVMFDIDYEEKIMDIVERIKE